MIHTLTTTRSFSLLLNNPAEFAGGGTYFAHLDRTVRPEERGSAVLHDSKALHAGVEIRSGLRMVLVGFVEYLDLGLEGGAPHAIDRLRRQVRHIQERQTRLVKKQETGLEEQELEGVLSMLSVGVAVEPEEFDEQQGQGAGVAAAAEEGEWEGERGGEGEGERNKPEGLEQGEDEGEREEGTEEQDSADSGSRRQGVQGGEDYDLAKDPIFGGVLDLPETHRAQYMHQEVYVAASAAMDQAGEATQAGMKAGAGEGADAFPLREELIALLAEQMTSGEEVEAMDVGMLSLGALTAKVLRAADQAAASTAAAESAAARRHMVLRVRPEDDETDLELVLDSLKAAALKEGSLQFQPLSWGDWELQPFCFGLQQLVVAAELPESVPVVWCQGGPPTVD